MSIISITVVCFTGFAIIPKVSGGIEFDDGNIVDIQYKNITWCSNNEVSLRPSTQFYVFNIFL